MRPAAAMTVPASWPASWSGWPTKVRPPTWSSWLSPTFATITGMPAALACLIGAVSVAGSGIVTTMAAGFCAAASVISFAWAWGSVVGGEL